MAASSLLDTFKTLPNPPCPMGSSTKYSTSFKETLVPTGNFIGFSSCARWNGWEGAVLSWSNSLHSKQGIRSLKKLLDDIFCAGIITCLGPHACVWNNLSHNHCCTSTSVVDLRIEINHPLVLRAKPLSFTSGKQVVGNLPMKGLYSPMEIIDFGVGML